MTSRSAVLVLVLVADGVLVETLARAAARIAAADVVLGRLRLGRIGGLAALSGGRPGSDLLNVSVGIVIGCGCLFELELAAVVAGAVEVDDDGFVGL